MKYKENTIQYNSSIRLALKVLDSTAMQILFVTDEEQHLLGTVTDGDIRRGLLKEVSLDSEVATVMNTTPRKQLGGTERAELVSYMQANRIRHLPLVDGENHMLGAMSLEELLAKPVRDNIVVLMVGGLGTRLRPLTNDCPKPLLKIGKKPILETILESFIECGFKRFYLAVNYKYQMIEDYFGDGSRLGVEIKYIHEKKRMGTAGALFLLPEKPAKPIIVMNGDLLTKLDFCALLDLHNNSKAAATMAVREYSYQVPYGVINCDEDRMLSIEEKPEYSCFVNAGIYVLNPDVVARVKSEEFLDMPDLFSQVINDGEKAGIYQVKEYWLDIGRLDDFERAKRDFG